MIHADDDEARTVITDWLIDSGCSAPMTPHREDFVDHLMDFSCAVEVATGTLVPCYFQGTVSIKITNVNTFDEYIVHLDNVLYVPDLSKRLLSVRHWNSTGDDIVFKMNHCVLTVCDYENNDSYDFTVRSPYDEIKEEFYTPDAGNVTACPSNTKGVRYVDTKLLHARLGHRSIPALIHASEHKMWEDTRISFGSSEFCN